MHMSDPLVSPAVAGSCWIIAAGLLVHSVRRMRVGRPSEARSTTLMGVLGSFVFAAQMVNVPILGTGSSGHFGGGILLAALLGPHAGFVAMASVLSVQAILFGDGGLLALGCNILNLGFFPAFVAYPWIYLPLVRRISGIRGTMLAAVAASIVGLQLGAVGVVLQTTASGITQLPLPSFAFAMLPIHFGIGVLEGLATAAVLLAVAIGTHRTGASPAGLQTLWRDPMRVGLLVATVLLGGVFSWFASTHPDGLEWSVSRAAGTEEVAGSASPWHKHAEALQKRTTILPDYGFADSPTAPGALERTGTSLSGITGAMATLWIILLLAHAARPGSANPVRLEVADDGKMIG